MVGGWGGWEGKEDGERRKRIPGSWVTATPCKGFAAVGNLYRALFPGEIARKNEPHAPSSGGLGSVHENSSYLSALDFSLRDKKPVLAEKGAGERGGSGRLSPKFETWRRGPSRCPRGSGQQRSSIPCVPGDLPEEPPRHCLVPPGSSAAEPGALLLPPRCPGGRCDSTGAAVPAKRPFGARPAGTGGRYTAASPLPGRRAPAGLRGGMAVLLNAEGADPRLGGWRHRRGGSPGAGQRGRGAGG